MNRGLLSIALLALGLLVVAPIGTLCFESFRVDFVRPAAGPELRGLIRDSDRTGVTIRVHGEGTSRFVKRADVAAEGRTLSFLHYKDVLAGTGERNMLLATIALAGASTLLALLIGLPLGLLLGATDLPGRRFFETLSVLPLVLPPILLAIATYHDLVDFEPGFLRAVIVFGLSLFPLVSLFTVRAVRAAGADSIDAARMQATLPLVIRKVLLGPALPGAAAGALLVFVFVVSDFAVPDFLGVTTAKNTITVYANAVFRYWSTDGDAGAAMAAGMPATLLAVIAFALVLRVESRRSAATIGGGGGGDAFAEPEPLPLGRARIPCLVAVIALLGLCLLWPAFRHLETAGGKHFGDAVALQGMGGQGVADDPRAKPSGVMDGLRRGLDHDRIGESTQNSLLLAGGGALIALLLALALTEAGRGRRRLDRVLLVLSFLPVAVPPMALAVGWVTLFGPSWAAKPLTPALLLGARLLPFATFAVRSARNRIAPEMLEAASVAGLGPAARTLRITLPLMAPGAALGFLLAFLFGLREVDAIIFTRSGAETLPVQLYNMIHYGFDVQVGALSFLWVAGMALFLLSLALVGGRRFRLLP